MSPLEPNTTKVRGPAECDEAPGRVTRARDVVWLSEELDRCRRRETELLAALENARASVRAKGDFLAHMSHELRSPMTAVVGMSELLMETTLSGEQRDMVSTVRRSAGALVSLVNDILDYSKIESGKMQVERRRFDLRECVEECLDLMAPNVRDKPVELLYEMQPDTPEFVVGDSNRVRQILVNLVGNAIKFTKEGEIVIEVGTECLDDRKTQMRVSVRDTGTGIPEEKLETLFGDYVQADASTARKHGGTGLGLSISRGLAELMNGRMWVESEVGLGSTFHFSFVCETCDEAGGGPSGVQPDLVGRRLLIVERNETCRKLLARQASDWGMDVVATGDWDGALAELSSGVQFDLAVVDRQVRDADGNGLSGEMQHINPTLPIVQLTSLAGIATSKQSARVGAAPVTYVSRPIKPKRLLAALCEAVRWIATGATDEPERAPTKTIDLRLGEKLNITILLADDELMIQRVARKFLEKMGFDAEIVSNGQELLDALHRRSFDVVLVDFNMPVMGGLEAATRIREEFTAETAPYVVAMTGVELDDGGACFAQGIDDVLAKPWGPHDLQKTLEDAAAVIQWRRERMLVAS